MMKSLSARAIVPVALTVTGFVLVCCILLYAGIKEDMTRDTVQHSLTLADTVIKSTRHAMLRNDPETVANIVNNVGQQQQVHHLRIFDKKGLIRFSPQRDEINHYMDKSAGGCLQCHAGPVPKATLEDMQKARRLDSEAGEILAVTAPIYNEPVCFTAVCHVHSAEQKTLGILDIGLDMTPLEQTLASLRNRMAIFSLMILCLTVGGVTALLRRNVLVPIQSLASFTESALRDNVQETVPEQHGEIGIISANFRHLHKRLSETRTELEALKAGNPLTSPAEGPELENECAPVPAAGGDS